MGVKVADSSGYRLLFGTIIFAFAVAVCSLVYFVVPGVLAPKGSAAAMNYVDATVIRTTPCDRPNATQRIRYTVDGRQQEADLTACDTQVGERVQVVLPDVPGSEPAMRRETIEDELPLGYRDLALLLLALGGMGGGCYVLLLGAARRVLPAAVAPRPAG